MIIPFRKSIQGQSFQQINSRSILSENQFMIIPFGKSRFTTSDPKGIRQFEFDAKPSSF